MKLSLRQKEVIKHMRKGHLMYKNVMSVILQYNHCSVSTFRALANRQLITSGGKYKQGRGTPFILTGLGNSIIL